MVKFNQVSPESIWTTPSADEFVPFLPSGYSFIDVLAEKIRKKGNAPATFYAKYMGVDYIPFCHTVQTLTGMTASKWIDRLVMMENEWWLLNTLLQVKEIAKKRGYGCGTEFSRAWKKRYKLPPEEFRRIRRRVIRRVVNTVETEIRLL